MTDLHSRKHIRPTDQSPADLFAHISMLRSIDQIKARDNDGDLGAALDYAHTYLQDHWEPGVMFNDKTSGACLLGSMAVAREEQKANFNVTEGAIKYLERATKSLYDYDGSISEWNDDPVRTKDEVLAVVIEAKRLYDADQFTTSSGLDTPAY